MNAIELFEHNKSTYEKVKALWKDSQNAAVVQATGTGKSYLIATILNDFVNRRKLVIAPSKYILHQLQEQFGFKDSYTLYFTYSKAMRLTTREIGDLNPELIVLDEYHRAGAQEWGKGIKKILKKYPRAYKFGTTATPVRYLDDARDMSQELFGGNVAAEFNLAQAINKGILPMPKYVSALYTLENEIGSRLTKIGNDKKINGERKHELFAKLNDIKLDFQKSRGIPFILKKHLNGEYKKLVVFCKNYKHLLEMEPLMKSWFAESGLFDIINTYRVVTAEPEREKSFAAFKEQREGNVMDLLLSVDMFNEGLHIKGVDGVVLLRETESPNIFYQQIGRGLKVGNDNHPVIFDFVNNFRSVHARTFLSDVEFSFGANRRNDLKKQEPYTPSFSIYDETLEVEELFVKLKEHDHPWNHKIAQLRKFKTEHGHLNIPTAELKNLISKLRTLYKKGNLNQQWIDALNEFGFEWVGDNETIFQLQVEQMKRFREWHGHLDVPYTDPELGRIAVELRSSYRKNKLSQKKIDTLNGLGFEWTHSQKKLEDSFNRKLEQLRLFWQEHGHLNMPRRYPEIGKHLDFLRRQYRKGRLDKKWVDALNEIDSRWFENDRAYSVNYVNRIKQLKQFKQDHGHLNIPSDEPQLGSFAKSIRAKYRKGQMEQAHINLLNHLNFIWDVSDERFQKRIEELKKYKQEYGHLNISIYEPKLGSFAKKSRKKYRQGTLDKKWVAVLNELGFAWNTEGYLKELRVDKWVELLRRFKQKHGHLNVPYHEPEIGIFAKRKRAQFRNGILDQQWIDVLNEVGFEWEYRKKGTLEQFQRRLEQLKKFKKENGHLKVPVKAPGIGVFASQLRIKYRKGELSQYWITALEELGFDWNMEK